MPEHTSPLPPDTTAAERRMPMGETLAVLHALRTDQVVLANMGSGREWLKLSQHPLDWIYVPSAMGEGPLIGLGLALAHPERQVIVGSGDGSLLMNLGCLVTIAAAAPKNFVLLTFDNGTYEVTGGQKTPAEALGTTGQRIDYAGLARASGFASVFAFDDLEDWRSRAAQVLASPGPVFAVFKVERMPEVGIAKPTVLPRERLAAFTAALNGPA